MGYLSLSPNLLTSIARQFDIMWVVFAYHLFLFRLGEEKDK